MNQEERSIPIHELVKKAVEGELTHDEQIKMLKAATSIAVAEIKELETRSGLKSTRERMGAILGIVEALQANEDAAAKRIQVVNS